MERIAAPAIAAAALLLLAGCSPQLPSAQYDACTTHASWVSEGLPADDHERLARVLTTEIDGEPESSVVTAVTDLVGLLDTGTPDDIHAASAQLTTTCTDAGWEPVEG